jgi:hypothetical protein
MGDLQMSGMAGRLVKVFDILTPVFMMVFFVMYLLEYDRRPISTEISEYLLFIISPNVWWIVRYIITGKFYPFYFQKTENNAAEEIQQSAQQISNPAVVGASKVKYILVWMFCSVLTTIISLFITTAFRMDRRFFLNNVEQILYTISVLDWVVMCVVWVGVYHFFKTLDVKKVMPFIYISAGFSFFVDADGATSTIYSDLNLNGWNFVSFNLALSVAFILVFRWFFFRVGRL